MRLHRLWLAWLALLAITIALPWTRDTHILTARAYFRLSGGQTYVTAGGYTHLTDSCREALAAAAGSSPDDYLLARQLVHHRHDFPSPAVWATDRLLGWAAMQSAERAAWADPFLHGGIGSEAAPELMRSIHDTLALVARAAEAEPDNGVIHLAEAMALFADRRDEAAVAALRVALQKSWNDHGAELTLRTQELLRTRVPFFDSISLGPARAAETVRSLCWRARDYLARPLLRAIQEDDHCGFESLLMLQRELGDAGFERPVLSLMSYAHQHEALTEAMAARLGEELPPKDASTSAAYEAWTTAGDRVWASYLRRFTPAIAETILAEEPARDAERERYGASRIASGNGLIWRVLLVETISQLRQVLLGLFLAALVVGILEQVRPPELTQANSVRINLRFLVVALPAYALMVFCIWIAVKEIRSESMCVLVSSDTVSRPLLTRAQEHLLMSGGLAALPLLLLMAGPVGWRVFRWCLPLVAFLYLGGIVAGAILRHQTVQLLSNAGSG